jgi:predicted transcriptional regulator
LRTVNDSSFSINIDTIFEKILKTEKADTQENVYALISRAIETKIPDDKIKELIENYNLKIDYDLLKLQLNEPNHIENIIETNPKKYLEN